MTVIDKFACNFLFLLIPFKGLNSPRIDTGLLMFRIIKRFNLKLKFLLLIGTLLGLTLYLSASITSRFMTESLTEEVTQRAIAIIKGIAQYSEEAILTKDRLALETMLNEAMKDPVILYVFILDKKQTILAHSDLARQGQIYFSPPSDRPKQLKDGVELMSSFDSRGEEQFDLIAPVIFAQKTFIGSVHVGFSKKPIFEAVKAANKKIQMIMLVSLLAGLLGAWLLAYFVVKPIRRLVEGVKLITDGHYPQIQLRSHDEIGLLVSSFNNMSKNLKEKELIKTAFSQYVSETVLESFLKNPDNLQLGGTRTEATILFTDIRNFTSLAEQLEPSVVVQILNEYFSAVIEIVEKYEGHLDKFIGDAVMVVFGTPVRHLNDEERAVRAAMEMNQRFQSLKHKWLHEGYPKIDINIGINTGEVVAGNVGSSKKLAYTVIGDSVNMAARIEKLNKRFHTQILISHSTYTKLAPILDVVPLPPTRVRGKSDEIQVYIVVKFRSQDEFTSGDLTYDTKQFKLI